MISERMDHPPFDDKATGTDIDQSHTRTLPIDTLPTELLERVIGLGATTYLDYGPELPWICMWRRVCWKWASVIDHCPALWSFILVENGAGHVPTQLAKSKGAPLNIRLWGVLAPGDEERIRLLVDNVHRWKSIEFNSDWEGVSAVLDSPPPMLEALSISEANIPPDSKLFNPSSPNLRVLRLSYLTIPADIQPTFGLEELRLIHIYETLEDGTNDAMSVRKLHQFLQASPGLQVLHITRYLCTFAADQSLHPVDLPNLKELKFRGPPAQHLFRAEHCADLVVILGWVEKKLPPAAWATVLPTLRRVKGLEHLICSTHGSS